MPALAKLIIHMTNPECIPSAQADSQNDDELVRFLPARPAWPANDETHPDPRMRDLRTPTARLATRLADTRGLRETCGHPPRDLRTPTIPSFPDTQFRFPLHFLLIRHRKLMS